MLLSGGIILGMYCVILSPKLRLRCSIAQAFQFFWIKWIDAGQSSFITSSSSTASFDHLVQFIFTQFDRTQFTQFDVINLLYSIQLLLNLSLVNLLVIEDATGR